MDKTPTAVTPTNQTPTGSTSTDQTPSEPTPTYQILTGQSPTDSTPSTVIPVRYNSTQPRDNSTQPATSFLQPGFSSPTRTENRDHVHNEFPPRHHQRTTSREEHILRRLQRVQMASMKLNAAIGLPSAHRVPPPPLPLAYAEASDDFLTKLRRGAAHVDRICRDAAKDELYPTMMPLFLKDLGLIKRLESYGNTHLIECRDIIQLCVHDVSGDAWTASRPQQILLKKVGKDMEQLKLHQMNLSDVSIGENGVPKLDGKKDGMNWMWFLLKEKSENGGGWIAFATPIETVRKVGDKLTMEIDPDGKTVQYKRVDLLYSFGGVPIFDGSVDMDRVTWAKIAKLMSKGECLVTYFYDPFAYDDDHEHVYESVAGQHPFAHWKDKKYEQGKVHDPMETQPGFEQMDLSE